MAAKEFLIDLFNEREQSHVRAIAFDPNIHRLRRRRAGLVKEGEDRILPQIAITEMRVDVEFLNGRRAFFPGKVPAAVKVELVFVLRPVGGALPPDAAEDVVVEAAFEKQTRTCADASIGVGGIRSEPVHHWLIRANVRVNGDRAEVFCRLGRVRERWLASHLATGGARGDIPSHHVAGRVGRCGDRRGVDPDAGAGHHKRLFGSESDAVSQLHLIYCAGPWRDRCIDRQRFFFSELGRVLCDVSDRRCDFHQGGSVGGAGRRGEEGGRPAAGRYPVRDTVELHRICRRELADNLVIRIDQRKVFASAGEPKTRVE